MVAKVCIPNVVTYTTIMNSLANSRELEEALGIVKIMKSSGSKTDILFVQLFVQHSRKSRSTICGLSHL